LTVQIPWKASLGGFAAISGILEIESVAEAIMTKCFSAGR
jgi:hypothetical protein